MPSHFFSAASINTISIPEDVSANRYYQNGKTNPHNERGMAEVKFETVEDIDKK